MQPEHRATRGRIFIQTLLGIGVYLAVALPFMRRAHGLSRLRNDQRYLFVCNHVSLLDTLLLGGLCWRSGNIPILTLGDKNVWHASWIRRLLSGTTSFLLDRGKLNPHRIEELEKFGGAAKEFNLIVFPEGTRGDGVKVAPCQPGIYFIAQAARVPIVPIFIENMQLVSTKHGKFHPLAGFRKVVVHFGEPIAPEKFLTMPREEFLEFIQRQIAATKSTPAT